jgi:hypothetical protein
MESQSAMHTDQYSTFSPSLIGDDKFNFHYVTMPKGFLDEYQLGNSSLNSFVNNGGTNPGYDVASYAFPMHSGWSFLYGIRGGSLLHLFCPQPGCSAPALPDELIVQGQGASFGEGEFYFRPSTLLYKFIPGLEIGVGGGLGFTVRQLPSNGFYSSFSFNGDFTNAGSLGFTAGGSGSGDANLYGSIPSGGQWFFDVAGTPVCTMDNTTLTCPDMAPTTLEVTDSATLPTATTIANGAGVAKEVCLQDGTNCPRPTTATNCSSAASPAVCGSAPAGSFVIAAGAVSTVVHTTAVTANSQILVYPDESLGTKLGVSCNTTAATALATSGITARTASTSFTVTTSGTVATHPACYSYLIVN